MKRYPIKFLDAYSKNDTDIFFGRKDEVDALYKMTYQTDILLVYGASGTGKTSLIQCGLASRFESHDWLDLYVRRGNNINESLKNTLIKAGGKIEAEDADWFDIELEENEIANQKPLSELQLQFKTIYLHAFRPIYLIFDQFEELYILGNKAEQQQFIENIKAILALDQPVKIIFSIREEYLGHLYDFERAIPQLLKKKLRVEPMNITKVQEVIAGTTTLKNSNVSVKKGELAAFTATVFERLQGKDDHGNTKKSLTIDLPYLQVFLDKIYLEITKDNTRTADAEFNLSALKNIGKIDDVLRQFLEEQVVTISRELRPKHPTLQAKHIWQILSPFVTLDGTKEPISTKIIQEKIKNTVENSNDSLTAELIETLIKSKIIRYLENDETYEIAHDSLAAKISEKRTDEEIALLEVHRLIKSQAAIKADARELFSEKQLNFIEPYFGVLILNEIEENLITESREQIERNKIAEKEAQTAELKAARAQARKEKGLRRRAVYIALFALMLAVVAGVFYFQAKEAEELGESNTFDAFIISSTKNSTLTLKKIVYQDIRKLNFRNFPIKEMPNDILKCQNIKSLFINQNTSNLNFLSALPSLRKLDLSFSRVSDISFLKQLSNLTTLNLSSTQVSDISFLKQLPNLTTLSLRNTQVSDTSFLKLGQLPNLTTLNLSLTKISDISFLKQFPNLTTLNLAGTQVLNIDILKEFPNLTTLNLAFIQDSDINLLKLEELPNLTRLYLSGIKISDINLLKLEELPNLRELDLSFAQVSDINFLKQLPNLTTLDLSGIQISNISFLKQLPNLAELNLSFAQVSDINFLKQLPNLTTLDLSGIQISNISFLKQLPNLTTLNLSSTQVSDINFLKQLPNLTTLDLSGTQVLDISYILENFSYLKNIKIENTNIPKDQIEKLEEVLEEEMKKNFLKSAAG